MEATCGAIFPFVGVSVKEFTDRRRPMLLPSDLRADWDMAIGTQVNVLLEGGPSDIQGSLAALRPHLRGPVCEFRPGDGACVPRPQGGTLILLEVARLDATQQTMLLRWFDEFDERVPVRIVSTSSEPLFSFVGSGAFPSELYYRLNAVLIKPARSEGPGPKP
jgi:Sigma-54 interaction domain